MDAERTSTAFRLTRAPRRVLMTTDPIGGVWGYSLELAGALRAHAVEVVLASMGAPLTSDQRAAARALPNVRLHESIARLEWMADPWDDVERAGVWLRRLADSEGVDVVHLNGYAHAALPWKRPVVVVAHSCVRSWWRAVKGCAPPSQYDEYRLRVRAGLLAADAVVAPTRAMLQALRSEYGLALTDAQVVPNGRTLPHADDLPVGAREPVVLAVGRVWDEAKNLSAVMRAAARLPWTVVLAGEVQPPPGASGTLLGAAELARVRALGRLPADTLAAVMRRSAICAHPALYEPFGLTALEAALAGCALVLGDIPSLREVWTEAALFVPPHDVEALVDGITRLMGDDARRAHLAEQARHRAVTFTPRAMAHAYVDLYAALLTGAGQTTGGLACAL